MEGSYRINVPQGSVTLIFSFIGYGSREIPVDNRTEINVVLTSSSSELDEVVVIGYGEQSREMLTTSVSKLDERVLENIPYSNTTSALQGTIAGLRVQSTSGQPGSRARVILRGGTSINNPNGSTPLYVIDGVIRDDMDFINSRDIASIQVLKDAASTSIYGSRASNGGYRPGIGLQNWVSRSNYPALNVVQTGENEMSLYVNQDYAQPTAHLRRYSMRLDGFASFSAGFNGGELLTKPFTFTGESLNLNYSTSAAGEVRIELLDGEGKKIPGFSMEESATVIGNEISRKVLWNGSSDVSRLSGKPVKMRIYLKDADLYSFQFR